MFSKKGPKYLPFYSGHPLGVSWTTLPFVSHHTTIKRVIFGSGGIGVGGLATGMLNNLNITPERILQKPKEGTQQRQTSCTPLFVVPFYSLARSHSWEAATVSGHGAFPTHGAGLGGWQRKVSGHHLQGHLWLVPTLCWGVGKGGSDIWPLPCIFPLENTRLYPVPFRASWLIKEASDKFKHQK